MAARSLGSVTLRLEFVSIPCKLFTAVGSKPLGFNMLHASCGSRLKQLLHCPIHNRDLERSDTVQAFEYAPDRYVEFTSEEIKALAAASDPEVLTIAQIVPRVRLDPVRVKKSWFLGPDKGSHRAFHLLGFALERADAIGVGKWGDSLAVIRPHAQGLALYELFYAADVRPYDEVLARTDAPVDPDELELVERLLARKYDITGDFLAAAADTWDARLKAAVQKKVDGEDVVIPPPITTEPIIDLVEALERSIAQAGGKRARLKGPAKSSERREPKGRRARRAAG